MGLPGGLSHVVPHVVQETTDDTDDTDVASDTTVFNRVALMYSRAPLRRCHSATLFKDSC